MLLNVTAQSLMRYLLPFLTGAAALCVGAILSYFAVGIIKRQIKLYNSIRLVELKSGKIHYWAFMLVIAFFIFYLTTQMLDTMGPEIGLMQRLFDMQPWQCNLMLGFAVALLVCVEFFLAALAFSKSAVVDKGVYTEFGYLDWYHVHDYIIDEDRGRVILSGNKYTFQTLENTTSPLKVAKNDIEKLKFILNKNKNKFSGFDKESL